MLTFRGVKNGPELESQLSRTLRTFQNGVSLMLSILKMPFGEAQLPVNWKAILG